MVEENESFDLRLLWLLVIPGILVAAILTRVFFLHVHDGNARSLSTSTLSVTVPAQVGRCAVPTAEQLAQHPTAVQANVTAVSGSLAQLRVTRVLAGQQLGRVDVHLPASGGAASDAGIPTFTLGDTYLLAISSDGSLAGCGMSGKATGDLESLYTKAFG